MDAAWTVESTHPAHECTACQAAVSSAIAIAKCTGSTGATHTDGQHVAVVTRGRPCFWGDPAEPNGCTRPATETIYWDGTDEPVCAHHLPEARAEVRDILRSIDDRMGL